MVSQKNREIQDAAIGTITSAKASRSLFSAVLKRASCTSGLIFNLWIAYFENVLYRSNRLTSVLPISPTSAKSTSAISSACRFAGVRLPRKSTNVPKKRASEIERNRMQLSTVRISYTCYSSPHPYRSSTFLMIKLELQ